MHPLPSVIAAAQSSARPSAIGQAVIVALVIIFTWRFAVFRSGKGTPAGRALAVLLALAVFWALLAVAQPSAAIRAAAGAASGCAVLLAAAAHILGSA